MSVAAEEIAESNAAFLENWRRVYPHLPHGEYREMTGLTAVWGDVSLPFCNAVLLSSPVNNRTDLEHRVRTLETFLSRKTREPMFLVCLDWLPDQVRREADAIIGRIGLKPAIPLFGMAADEVRQAAFPLPALEYREVSDLETRNLISDINSFAYGFALEYGREAFTSAAAWRESNGYLGSIRGEAVTSAAITTLDGRLYVGFVATLPAHRRRGYAEAVMRYSLAQSQKATGIRRSLLHATKEGYTIYARMGYRQTARFMGYVRQP